MTVISYTMNSSLGAYGRKQMPAGR